MQQEPPIVGRAPDESGERKLVAVVHADVVGYSRLIGLDDKGTVFRLSVLRDELIEPELRRHGASLVNTAGDSMMLVFPSITAAVRCALDFQRRVPEYDADMPPDRLIRFRIGINIADIISDHADIHGDGVNIAARLQAVCPPGGVCVSRAVYDHVRGRLSLPFEPLGELQLKNITQKVEAFVVRLEASAGSTAGLGVPAGQRRPYARRLALVGLLLVIVGGTGWWVRQQQTASLIESTRSAALEDAAAPPLSIAVLPLTNLSGDPEQAYLADGIAEDLTTDLSHLSGAQVVARESAFSYKGRPVDVREVGRQLSVRYVLEGSVRKLGDVVRVNAQLIATDTGAHVWAERFDEPTRNLASGQDEIVARIGSALNVQLVKADSSQRAKKPKANPAAFDLVLRARSVLNQPPTWVSYTIAAGLYEQALQLDPESVSAMTGVASMLLRVFTGKIFVKRAADLIAAAEHQAPGSPEVLVAKFLLQRKEAQWEDSMITFREILKVDSGAAGIVAETRICSGCWGSGETAIPLLTQAVRLNPRSPNIGVLQVNLGRLLLLAGQDAEAITWLERGAQDPADHAWPSADAELPVINPRAVARFLLASAYALTDRVDDAHHVLALALQPSIEMDMTIRSWLRGSVPRFASPSRVQRERRIAEGLRRAGLRDHLDEEADSGVPPEGTLREPTRVDEPTPMSVAGATTIRTEEMQRLLEQSKPLVLTTAGPQYNPTVPGAIRIELPSGGNLTDEWQPILRRMVDGLIGDRPRPPIVVFGYSINHWDARNIVLRLLVLGYKHVYWYRGGWEAWDAHDLPTTALKFDVR